MFFRIKINVDKVAPFDDAEQNKRLLREGRERENGDLLVKAVQKAEEHLRKQCLGESNLVKVLGDLEADFSDVHSDDDRPDHSNLISAGSSRSPGTEAMDSMDDESVFANAQTMDQWKERRRVRNAQLLQCVKEGKVETHLLGVYTGSIQSERHQVISFFACFVSLTDLHLRNSKVDQMPTRIHCLSPGLGQSMMKINRKKFMNTAHNYSKVISNLTETSTMSHICSKCGYLRLVSCFAFRIKSNEIPILGHHESYQSSSAAGNEGSRRSISTRSCIE